MTKDPLSEIDRVDRLLDLNREMLLDAEKMPIENERLEKVTKVKGRINTLLDERIGWMKKRDEL